MPVGQLKHILCWGLIGGVFKLLRNLLRKTVKPSIYISDFISMGSEVWNRSSFFTFILTCKCLGARKNKLIVRFLFIF